MTKFDSGRRQALRTIGAAGALLAVGGVGTAAAKEGASSENTIVEIAVDGGFDTLVAAVQEAGLVDALSGNRQLTVFAPTDDAFGALGVTASNVESLDDQFLLDVLTYHVTPGRRYAASVVNAPEVPTLNGTAIDVDGTVLNDGQANIVATDIEASNGVVHVIDGVLLP